MSTTSLLRRSYGVEPARSGVQKLQITAVVPVVRWAILRRHVPHLTKDQTDQVHIALERAWPAWREAYRSAVANRAGADLRFVSIDSEEIVRLRTDGKTPMIDFPRVCVERYCDLRNCAALCVDDFSSKFWTRVGPLEFGTNFAVDRLSDVLADYRALAQSCGEWFRAEMFRIGDPSLNQGTVIDEGTLEVTTVGLQLEEEQSDDEVNAWLFDGDRPNFENDDFRRFFTQAAGLDYDIREVESREPNAFWMSMPMAVRLRNGNLAIRQALYLVRSIENGMRVVGIGLDDSEAGDFANAIALKVSRAVANRV